MTDPTTPVDRLRAVITERLTIARAANGRRRAGDSTPAGGEHWQWECGDCDVAIPITPVTILDEYVQCPNSDEHGTLELRSVEEYPTLSVGSLPHFVVNYAQELRPADALAIASNASPAFVIKACERDLRVLDRHAPTTDGKCCRYCCRSHLSIRVPFPCPDLADLAEVYGVDLTGGTP